MRISIYLTVLILLASFNVLAADTGAPSPFPIWGIISLNGDRVNTMQVSLTYPTTGEVLSLEHTVVMGGELVTDLSWFSQRVNPDNEMIITYCISDSRCRETSDTFVPTEVFVGRNGISKDLILTPTGLSGPYLVHGHVWEYGVLQTGVDVFIENVDKGYSITIETNEAGEYQWQLANWGIYDTGDLIRITWNDNIATGLIFEGGLSLDIKILEEVIVPVVVPPGGDGGGGGNNGGTCNLDKRSYWLRDSTCQSTCPGYDSSMIDRGYVKIDYNCFTEQPEDPVVIPPEEVPDDITDPIVEPDDPDDSIIPDMPDISEKDAISIARIIGGIFVCIIIVAAAVYFYRKPRGV